uniref:Epidermal differentiation protein n=1 Tax=Panagrolaimus superbus TaxID=310955 RepID=A0A914Z4G9_9BILA
MGHCHSRPRCHSNYSYYSRGCEPCEPCHPCEPPRIQMMQHGYQTCHCHSPQIIMFDSPGRGYGRKNAQQMCQCGGYIPENRIPQQSYYPQSTAAISSMPPYPPGPINPGNYVQPLQHQQTPYPSQQQQPIPISSNNYPQMQQQKITSKPQSSQPPRSSPKPQSSQPPPPRSSSPPPPYS